MHVRPLAFALFVLSLLSGAAEPVDLFNGKTLDGWESVGSAKWRAEDGMIVGGQDGDPRRSGILLTKKSYQDFDLELEFLIDEHGKYNSGVYLRHGPGARRQRGYQVNIGRGAAEEYVGLHYKEWLDKGDEKDEIRKPREWNHLRIRAVGAHIQVWLNTKQIVDYTDPDPQPEHIAPGVLGFQTYGAEGHAGFVKFRNLRITDLSKPSTATIPVPQRGMEKRHAQKVELIAKNKYDLLLIGDSITHNFDNPRFKSVWDQFYAPRNAICLGYSGGRTENTLWNLQNGELEGQSPKVATLLIGTNNCDDANYSVVHTADEIFEGTKAIVALLRKRLPKSKIIVLRIFPRTNVYKKADGTERGSAARRSATNKRAGELTAALADNEHVFYLDVNEVFLRPDGSLDPKLMPDLLHPSPTGAQKWADAMVPLLSKLFGDTPRS